MISAKPLFIDRNAVIFDFDGTIADSFAIHETAFNQALEKHKLQFQYKDYTGISTNDAIKRIFQDNDRDIKKNELLELVKLKRKLANELYQSTIQFIPGADQFITSLFAQRYSLFVASSGSRMNITTGIRSLGIGKYFKDVITADDVPVAKPDPAIFLEVINKHSISPDKALVIEDSPAGLLAAQAAGIDAVCVDKTIRVKNSSQTEFFFFDFFELSAILEKEYGKGS